MLHERGIVAKRESAASLARLCVLTYVAQKDQHMSYKKMKEEVAKLHTSGPFLGSPLEFAQLCWRETRSMSLLLRRFVGVIVTVVTVVAVTQFRLHSKR